MEKIQDFGEKIGGAKKDLWRARNFTLSDLDYLSEREAFKYCVKDTVWPKPDYEEMCKEKPVIVVYFIKKIRDSLPAKVKPTQNDSTNKFNRQNFVSLISMVRDTMVTINKESELYTLFNRILVENEYYVNKSWTPKAASNISLENR